MKPLINNKEVTVGVSSNTKPLSVTQNGNYYANEDNCSGYNEVTVAVPSGDYNINSIPNDDDTYDLIIEDVIGVDTNKINPINATATPNQVLKGKSFYAGDTQLKVGNIETYTGNTQINYNTTLNTSNKYLTNDIIIDVPQGQMDTKYTVKVIDYKGDIIIEEELESGEEFTLPQINNLPNYLSFNEWISNAPIANNKITITDRNVLVGGSYTCEHSRFDITLNKSTGLTITFNVNGTKDWGDGTQDDTTSHTYNDYGNYTIIGVSSIITTSTSTNTGIFGSTNYSCTNVVIGEDLLNANNNTLDNYTFYQCNNLKNVLLSNGLAIIEANAFLGCKSLKNIILPKTLEYIMNNAFSNCYTLNDILFSNNPQGFISLQIYSNVFYSDMNIKDIILPNYIISVGDYLFANCSNLETIILPQNITTISNWMFGGCSKLNNITLPNGIISIGNYAFSGCRSLTNIIIPNGVISIGQDAFSDCSSLNNINIPNSVISIGQNAFSQCYASNSITFENNSQLTTIGVGAFGLCYNVTSIIIPKTILSITDRMFMSLYNVLIYNFSNYTEIPQLNNVSAFRNINTLAKIIVPSNLYESWKVATNWIDLANYIYSEGEI